MLHVEEMPIAEEQHEDRKADQVCQTSNVTELKRNMFIVQATREENCYRYTGLPKEKLDLISNTVKEKASKMRYWKGSINTTAQSKRKGNRGIKKLLPLWDEFVLTIIRTRKGFNVYFLADTFGITSGQVSRIYNTWVILLSEELSFLVPWPNRGEIRKTLLERFRNYPNLRIIIDCFELFIQKAKLPSKQKITWSNYKHRNRVRLLIGITPMALYHLSLLHGLVWFQTKKLSGLQVWLTFCKREMLLWLIKDSSYEISLLSRKSTL